MIEQTSEPTVDAPAYIGGAARVATISLAFPVSYGGRDYRAIVLHRLSARAVADWQEQIREAVATQPDKIFKLPICHDTEGNLVPEAVLDALDDDDQFEIERQIVDFLPRRFRGDDTSGSPPPTGAPVAP